MILSFTLTKHRDTLIEQWTFLFEKSQDYNLKDFKTYFVRLLLISISFIVFYYATNHNTHIAFKGVTITVIILLWVINTGFFLWIYLSKLYNKSRLLRFLNSFSDEELNYSVEIDEEKIIITSNLQSRQYLWQEFSDFGMNKETIYVLNATNGIDSLYWSKKELGDENYILFLETVKKKGIPQAF